MAKFARNSKYLCFGTFSGADTQKEQIQSCTGGLSLYSALCMYDTLYGPSVQIGPSQLLTVTHIISPHPSLPETAHHEPPSIGKARIEVC